MYIKKGDKYGGLKLVDEQMIKEFETWLGTRPAWNLQAFNRIQNKLTLDEEDIKELTEFCINETICKEKTKDLLSISKASNDNIVNNEEFSLEFIDDINGIAALNPRKPLEFKNKKLCVIYGENGTGKSSYVKAMKHACGTKNSGELLSNVFANDNQNSSIKICLSCNDIKKEIECTNPKFEVDEIRNMSFFDTNCSKTYINKENEVTFEPWILIMLSRLIECCDKVANQIKKRIENNPSSKPLFPNSLIGTAAHKWYTSINSKVKDSEVENKCMWNENLSKELNLLNKILNENNPAEKIKSLKNNATSVEALIKILKRLESYFAYEKCIEFFRIRKDAIVKRKLATDDVNRIFDSSPIEGVGSEVWKLMWEKAREYSNLNVYPTHIFPNIDDGARCVLCQQELNQEAKARLVSFEEYIKSTIEQDAIAAEKLFLDTKNSIVDIPKYEYIDARISSAGILNEIEIEQIKGFVKQYSNRKKILMELTNIEILPEITQNNLIKNLEDFLSEIFSSISVLKDNMKTDEREKNIKKKNEFEATKWLHDQKLTIIEERNRLIEVEKLKKAINLVKTIQLSEFFLLSWFFL